MTASNWQYWGKPIKRRSSLCLTCILFNTYRRSTSGLENLCLEHKPALYRIKSVFFFSRVRSSRKEKGKALRFFFLLRLIPRILYLLPPFRSIHIFTSLFFSRQNLTVFERDNQVLCQVFSRPPHTHLNQSESALHATYLVCFESIELSRFSPSPRALYSPVCEHFSDFPLKVTYSIPSLPGRIKTL